MGEMAQPTPLLDPEAGAALPSANKKPEDTEKVAKNNSPRMALLLAGFQKNQER